MLPSRVYSKSEIEAALIDAGLSEHEIMGGFTHYYDNKYPGRDLMLHWSRKSYEWEDIRPQLVFHGIDPEPIHTYLVSHP